MYVQILLYQSKVDNETITIFSPDFESPQPGPSLKKKLKKEKSDKKLKKKPTAKKISEMDIDVSNVDDDDDFDMKTTSSMTRDDDIGSEDFVNVE